MTKGQRPETAPMQFGDDWRGLFIRGDNAFGFKLALERALASERLDPLTRHQLQELADLLARSDHFVEDPELQRLKDFDACQKK